MSRPELFVFLVLLFTFVYPSHQASTLGERTLPTLSQSEISRLVSSDPVENLDPSNPSSHLSNILIPRVGKLTTTTSFASLTFCATVETENNTKVRKYIISTLQALDWHIEEDEFTDDTPLGRRRFTNVIATKDPTATRRVVLSAHYDSKYFPDYPNNQVCCLYVVASSPSYVNGQNA